MNWEEWDKVPGWMNVAEGKVLYEETLNLPKESTIVEIGCFRGKSTVALLSACSEGCNGRVEVVDNFSGTGEKEEVSSLVLQEEGSNLFYETVGEWNLFEWLGGLYRIKSNEWFSILPVGILFDLFFIDGLHPNVAVDAMNAWNKLRPGGVLLCHDYDVSARGPVVEALDKLDLPGGHVGISGASIYKAVKS